MSVFQLVVLVLQRFDLDGVDVVHIRVVSRLLEDGVESDAKLIEVELSIATALVISISQITHEVSRALMMRLT